MSLSLSPVATTGVLFPLYIYPTSTAWDPLYSAITNNPSVNFYVIINPDSGPGGDEFPNSDYITAIQKLKTYDTVTPLGYVHTTHGAETTEAVEANITKYKNWDTYSTTSPISLSGIFFDEAPSSAADVEYMTSLSSFTKTTFGTSRDFVVFNPGTIVDPGYFNAADAIVIIENTEAEYSESVFSSQSGAQDPHQKVAILHDFTGGASEQTSVVQGMVSQQAGLIYITTQSSYNSFSGLWSSFVSALAAAIS